MFTWVALPVAATSYYLIAVPFVPKDGSRAVVLTIYTLLLVAVLISWLVCSYYDPNEDAGCFCPCMKEAQKEKKYCATCKKHVPGLDHHCVWLNTCIGRRTYPYFYALAACGTFMSTLHAVVAILLLTDWFDEEKAEDAVGSVVTYKVLISIVFVGAVALIIAFGILFGFHTMLLFKKKGTYAWLLDEHEKKMENQEAKRRKRFEEAEKKEAAARSSSIAKSEPSSGTSLETNAPNSKGKAKLIELPSKDTKEEESEVRNV